MRRNNNWNNARNDYGRGYDDRNTYLEEQRSRERERQWWHDRPKTRSRSRDHRSRRRHGGRRRRSRSDSSDSSSSEESSSELSDASDEDRKTRKKKKKKGKRKEAKKKETQLAALEMATQQSVVVPEAGMVECLEQVNLASGMDEQEARSRAYESAIAVARRDQIRKKFSKSTKHKLDAFQEQAVALQLGYGAAETPAQQATAKVAMANMLRTPSTRLTFAHGFTGRSKPAMENREPDPEQVKRDLETQTLLKAQQVQLGQLQALVVENRNEMSAWRSERRRSDDDRGRRPQYSSDEDSVEAVRGERGERDRERRARGGRVRDDRDVGEGRRRHHDDRRQGRQRARALPDPVVAVDGGSPRRAAVAVARAGVAVMDVGGAAAVPAGAGDGDAIVAAPVAAAAVPPAVMVAAPVVAAAMPPGVLVRTPEEYRDIWVGRTKRLLVALSKAELSAWCARAGVPNSTVNRFKPQSKEATVKRGIAELVDHMADIIWDRGGEEHPAEAWPEGLAALRRVLEAVDE